MAHRPGPAAQPRRSTKADGVARRGMQELPGMSTYRTTPFLTFAVLTLAMPAVHAQGIFDRIRERANEAAESVRDVRESVEDITEVDERAAAEVNAAQREVEAATDVEGQARRAASDTETAQSAREVQREAARIETTDERLERQARGEVAATERDVRNVTDVEARAERAVLNSEPARAVVQTEREITRIEQTDERVQANAERRVDDTLGVSDAQRAVNETERDVRGAQRAVDNLESALE